jgi:cytoskeletal protein CcmA (bactofilin family)
MSCLRSALFGAAMLCCATAAWADTVRVENGGDTFHAGEVINETLATPGDVFATARTVNLSGDAAGDLHATGFDVMVTTNTAEDLYAFGGAVVIRGNVGRDLTLAGLSVRTDAGSATRGNARLFARTLAIEGPVRGALSAVGQDVFLNAAVDGDVRILAQSISFGPKATIAGTLTYSSTDAVAVPERVVPAQRVMFERLSPSEAWDEWDMMHREMPVWPTFASLLFGYIVTLSFFVVLGAVVLGFMPARLEKMRQSTSAAPGQTILLGVIGLSMLFGMVPISGMTIIGLPFVPVVLLAIVVFWTFGYALGAYCVSLRVWTGFGGAPAPALVTRLLVFAAAITLVALLNFIPFVGWVANFTLVLLGLGAMTKAVFRFVTGKTGADFDINMQPVDDKNRN